MSVTPSIRTMVPVTCGGRFERKKASVAMYAPAVRLRGAMISDSTLDSRAVAAGDALSGASRVSAANSPRSRGWSANHAAPQRAHQARARRQSPCTHANCILAGVYTRPASRRALPRRSQNSRAEPHAHSGTRRTFHTPRGPPETEAERARSVLPSFGCHVTTG